MGWETRRNGRYYYLAERKAGRVIKRYVGSGEAGEAAARAAAARKAERAERRDAELQQRKVYETLADQTTAVHHEAAAVLEAQLLIAGFYRPQRKTWRRRRVQGND
jgi:hypothetical protein